MPFARMQTMNTPQVGILQIAIRDFRGIDELTVSFAAADDRPSGIFVLGGPNGSGKTTVLEACLTALGRTDLVRGASGRSAVRVGTQNSSLTIDVKTPFTSLRGVVGSSSPALWSSLASPERPALLPPLEVWYFSSWRAPSLVGSLGITAGRRGKRPAPTEVNRLWRAKQYLVNARAQAVMGGDPSNKAYDQVIDKLNRIWQRFYPGLDWEFLVSTVSRDPEDGFDVFLSEGDVKRLVPVDCLSSGQLEVFTFFASLVTAKTAPDLLLIDEPELHLDPAWHVPFVRSLQDTLPNTQILLATHSPEIFDSVYSFQRTLLLPEDDPRIAAWHRGPQEATT